MKKKMKQAWKDQDKRKRRSDYAKSRWSDENEKQKLIQSIKDACCKKIVCEQTGKIYQSIEEASKEIGVSGKNARRALVKHYSWGGYHWKYLNDVS